MVAVALTWDNLLYDVPHMTTGPTLDCGKGCSLSVFSITASVNNALKVASLKGVIYWAQRLRDFSCLVLF